jgi:predicted nucleotidyltransferase
MQNFITVKRDTIVELCRTHHVRRLSIFGSAVRDDFDPINSDVDVRVEFEPDIDQYVENFHSLHDALVVIFGRKVDILSAKEIRNPFLKREIENSQVTMYAA